MPAKKPAPKPRAKPAAKPGAKVPEKARPSAAPKEPAGSEAVRRQKASGKPGEPKTGITLAVRQNGKLPVETCGNCGHWSSGAAFGLDERSGYCNHWERITNYDQVCPDFLTKDEYQEVQQQLAEDGDDEDVEFD